MMKEFFRKASDIKAESPIDYLKMLEIINPASDAPTCESFQDYFNYLSSLNNLSSLHVASAELEAERLRFEKSSSTDIPLAAMTISFVSLSISVMGSLSQMSNTSLQPALSIVSAIFIAIIGAMLLAVIWGIRLSRACAKQYLLCQRASDYLLTHAEASNPKATP